MPALARPSSAGSVVSLLTVALCCSVGCVDRGDTQNDDAALLPAEPPVVAPVTTSEAPPKQELKRNYTPSRGDCEAIPVFVLGAPAGSVCGDDAAREGLTVVDLSDTWTPRVFEPNEAGVAPPYRAKYLALATQPKVDLGLHGILPTMTILAARVTDEKRRACEEALDDSALSGDPKSKEAITAMQGALVCEGFLKKSAVNGRLTQTTQSALEIFRRRHMMIGARADADTVAALALGSDELAFRALLRGLRERVAMATGIIEDGTASNHHAMVQGRELDLTRFAPGNAAQEAAPPSHATNANATNANATNANAANANTTNGNAALDLLDMATDVAARELGWVSPDAARSFIADQGKDGLESLHVAIRLPPAPSYHTSAMDLRVEIDRGDVTRKSSAARKKGGDVRRPTLVVYAKDGDREIALMSWQTTIGGWKKVRLEDGEVALRYKDSDVGDRVWRKIIAAPAWLPPDSTPDTDLVRVAKDGTVTLKSDLFQPGYRNAYGLVTLLHEESVERDDETKWLDHGIRTHGSVDYRSIRNGSSHGCHRLYNQLALRLSGFLLDHRSTRRRGKMHAGYHRTIELEDQTIDIDIPTRGYLYELDPPVPVRVLEGNVAGSPSVETAAAPASVDRDADETKEPPSRVASTEPHG